MSEPRTYPQGVPCWVDTEQPDLQAACDFYGELFGWQFEDVVPSDTPGSYCIARLDGQDVAAVAASGEREPVTWNTYIAVRDADEAAARVSRTGGTVISAPQDAGPGGRRAICADPAGARFRLWQARQRPGAQRANEPGTWNFSDLHTDDPATARSYYAAAFGWEADQLKLGPQSTVTLWRQPGYGEHLAATVDATILERQEGIGAPPGFADAIAWLHGLEADAAPHWHVTFSVADRDASAAVAANLGATVVTSTDGEWTRSAVIRDPQGAQLTLSQFRPPNQ